MKHKTFTLILLLITAGFVAEAHPVDMRTAREVAMKFVNANAKTPLSGADELQLAKTYNINRADAAFYVFNAPNGFVIVSADDCAYPILGYSDEGRRFDVNNVPIQLQDILQEYTEQIQYAVEHNLQPDEATAQQWRLVKATGRLSENRDRTQVGPLLTTTWDQGQFYNAMCPADANGPDGHCVTGCVATAMAQIIKYHGYPASGRGTHSYDSNYGTLTVNYAESVYDYANMPDALTNESTEAQVNAVAKLISDCGVAVNMGYSGVESSAYDQEARAALINFFKYSPNLSFAEKSFFTSDEWSAMLQTELNANRVVYYSGRETGGHAFVCDGYNTDGYYHFNFGWSGAGNEWYLLEAVNPLGMDFNSDQSAILGIVPDANGNVILGQMTGTSTFTVDEPLEFYHTMGHNLYEGYSYSNPCSNTVYFIPSDATNQMVVDIMEYDDQNLTIYDGNSFWLRSLSGGLDNDLSPVVSTANAISIAYSGNLFYAGFKLNVSQDTGCRMVSNIFSSIDATTVHLTWTENGGATQWQVEYGIKGFELGEGTVYNTTTNTVTFENLEKFTEYDFYIRSVCGNNQFGLWNKVTLMVEAEYWQDVVTSQPEGYSYNPLLNGVEISSAEGLAWWARSGCTDNAYLTANIDLSEFKWKPVYLGRNFNGQGHVISNAYIRETTSDVGLFSDCSPGDIIEDLGVINAYVYSSSYRVGGLFGTFRGIMRNCYVNNSSIDGTDYTAGLIGESDYGTVVNCYVNANVIGNRWTGLLIGNSWQGTNRNCYAAGTLRHRSYCYNAGIAAYAGAGEITNCYSVETEMGVVGFGGATFIADTSAFVQSGTGWTLLTPIMFDDVSETDLLSALNRGVAQINDGLYCTWVADTENKNGGYPVLGDKYVVQCPNVSDVSVQNVRVDNNNAVVINWTENGEATQWRIRYRRHDLPNSDYSYITTTNNPCTITEIQLGYVYDFNVRAICDTDNLSGWSATSTIIVDLPYWTDIVTTQPEGYLVDNNGNVEISSAEGLAWLAVLVNGLNGHTYNTFDGKLVAISSDINLEGYRWNPIGGFIDYDWRGFSGTFDGQGHSISNIYVNDAWSNLGLFGFVEMGSVKNVVIQESSIASIYTDSKDSHSLHSSAIGGLIGFAADCYEITNCHSSANVYANGGAGALCGYLMTNSGFGERINGSTIISNCSAAGTVYGRESCGGLIGNVCGDVVVCNCYSTGDVNESDGGDNSWYRGGLIGLCQYASIYNCYSIGEVINGEGKVIGFPCGNPSISYIYGQDDINIELGLIGGGSFDNIAQFHHNGNTNALLTSVSVEGIMYIDLLEALNAWVTLQNDQNLKTWTIDGTTGYPVFGDFFEPSCYNPTNLTVSQATVVGDPVIRTELAWNQIGEPNHWEVLYVASEHDINEGTVVSIDTNPYIITDIPVGHPLDFYVRAVCGNNDVSNWSNPVTYIPDKLRWTEVVTSQPEGYIEDTDGNVYISSAEGLAWLSSVVNGLNGMEYNGNRFYHKRIELLSDINLSEYRWTTIGKNWEYSFNDAVFNGNNHSINGLYCNELDDYQGLFGYFFGGSVSNVILNNCTVFGENRSGSIVGHAIGVDLVNCAAVGNVYGIDEVGGLVGKHETGEITQINNCYFRGDVVARRDITKANTNVGYIGGIVGTSFFSSIFNCYVVSEISDDGIWSGIITGTGGRPSFVSNCYYKDYETSLPVTSNNCNTSNNSSFSGSGITWTLNTPPYVNGDFRTDLLDALNAWVDANNTNGEYLHWVADTAMINGGFPILEQLTATTVQTAELSSGWSWYSTYIEQQDIDGLAMLENSMDTACSRIQSRTEFIDNLEYMGYHFWDGTLSAITNEQSYRIRTTSPCQAVITGQPALPENHPITVNTGWNWIGFPSAQPLSLTSALSAFAPEVNDQIKGRYNFATYLGNYGGVDYWDGLLTTLEPGQGYMYRSFATTAKTLVYQTGSKGELVPNGTTEGNYYQPVCEEYAENMTVTAEVELNGTALRSEYELAAFAGDECRGSVKLRYVAPVDRYEAFLMVFGDGGEELSFVLTDGEETYWSNDRVVFSANAILGNPAEPYVIRFGSTSVSDKLAQSLRVYPNPVERGERFSIGMNDAEEQRPVRIEIVNALGALVKSETLSQWPATLVAPATAGVYTLKIVVDDKTVVCRRVVVK